MATRMLIDARHPEETRVAVLKGNRIEEFDFESAEHKQIKGNIYLAKVTRVEPSLQAAFVDFGGNRHGFLAFSEIHPDYYQIPQADREALLAEEQAHAEEEAALRADEDEEDFESRESDDDDDDDASHVEEIDTGESDEVATIEDGQVENGDDESDDEGAEIVVDEEGEPAPRSRRGRGRRQGGGNRARAKEMDELRAKRQALRRRYKIQDVIQRRQVLLVQVVKEERGNKGAALTTYLSLAGRYCVLMPNSGHGGGISRKISSTSDRKRLKQIVGELSLPKSMGLIVRTAGLQRTKTEIKRDFDYLARLWDEIRETTLASSAPAMIHSDSDLIKRAIRDIYNKEIEEVVVEGEGGYRAAKEFMKLLMPSHARRVKQYADAVPLFQRYGAEDQLSAMYDPVVQLKSGGYLVINPTEALVSIDINSGRSTKEHGIEATALNTNLEAAREIARQLRLRDMAGLVVIDFIDMEYGSNIRKVEKAMKDALKDDRARIQVGRISGFGLMEMSRQRLRTGVLEATTRACPHCDGTGLVRTASSAGLSALRLIEDEAAKGKGTTISLYASTEAAVYLLNAKRSDLAEIEDRYGVRVEVLPEGEQEGAKMRVTSTGPRPTTTPRFEPIVEEEEEEVAPDGDIDEAETHESDSRNGVSSEGADERQGKRRRRRRGGRGRNRHEDRDGSEDSADAERDDAESPTAAGEDAHPDQDDHADGNDRPRKRRRRGGRRRHRREENDGESVGEDGESGGESESESEAVDQTTGFEGAEAAETIAERAVEEVEPEATDTAEEAPAPKRRTRRKKPVASETEEPVAVEAATESSPEPDVTESPAPKPRSRRKKTAPSDAEASEPQAEPAPAEIAEIAPEPVETKADADTVVEKPKRSRRKATPAEPSQAEPAEAHAATGENETSTGTDEPTAESPPRRGWWQRTFGE